jgi:hypothetical protein
MVVLMRLGEGQLVVMVDFCQIRIAMFTNLFGPSLAPILSVYRPYHTPYLYSLIESQYPTFPDPSISVDIWKFVRCCLCAKICSENLPCCL